MKGLRMISALMRLRSHQVAFPAACKGCALQDKIMGCISEYEQITYMVVLIIGLVGIYSGHYRN